MNSLMALMIVLMALVAASAAADWLPHVTRARCRCRLPGHDYAPRRLSGPSEGATYSAVAVLVETAAEAGTAVFGARLERAPRARTFVLAQSGLQVDHCVASQVAVTLIEDGRWIVNVRAVQTPDGLDAHVAESTARFLRNRFHLSVRAYGNYELREPAVAASPLAKPQLFCIEPDAFWVERGAVRNVHLRGILPIHERELMAFINRMEIEFRYE